MMFKNAYFFVINRQIYFETILLNEKWVYLLSVFIDLNNAWRFSENWIIYSENDCSVISRAMYFSVFFCTHFIKILKDKVYFKKIQIDFKLLLLILISK
jgi:hypothetical protein